MTDKAHKTSQAVGMFEPIKWPFFRAVWLGSIFSSMGVLIQSVSAAWLMTEIADAQMVALVQTASFLPLMIFAIPSGAITDMFDRYLVQIISLGVSFVGTAALTLVAVLGALGPWTLLALCFVIGSGMALLGPALQASVRDEVPLKILPQAIALRIASFNVARSTGPAIGGVIVASAGASIAFAISALSYVPLLVFLIRWRGKAETFQPTQSRFLSTITSGIVYIFRSKELNRPIFRVFVFAFSGASILALLPVIARINLNGGADTYGILFACFGLGAVGGVMSLNWYSKVRREVLLRCLIAILVLGMIVLAFSTHLIAASLACLVLGAVWTMVATVLNIVLQLLSPSWMVGRVVSVFQAFFAGGVALGSWVWGLASAAYGSEMALLISAGFMGVAGLMGFVVPVQDPNPQADNL